MTWVIGAVDLGIELLVGDVRVSRITFSNTVEPVAGLLVRKVHKIGPRALAGFAGKIELGFHLVEDLKSFSPGRDEEAPDEWVPQWFENARAQVTASWPPQKRGTRLLIVALGNHGTMWDNGRMVGHMPIANGHGWIATFPADEAARLKRVDPGTITSIGSGSGIPYYREQVQLLQNLRFVNDWPDDMTVELFFHFLGEATRKQPDPTISHDLCAGMVTEESGIVFAALMDDPTRMAASYAEVKARYAKGGADDIDALEA